MRLVRCHVCRVSHPSRAFELRVGVISATRSRPTLRRCERIVPVGVLVTPSAQKFILRAALAFAKIPFACAGWSDSTLDNGGSEFSSLFVLRAPRLPPVLAAKMSVGLKTKITTITRSISHTVRSFRFFGADLALLGAKLCLQQ